MRALLPTIIAFVIAELALHAVYAVRNAMVPVVPLPSAIGYEFGPVPPWVDGLRLFEPDDVLMWRNRPNARRRYLDVFGPVHRADERTALVRRFVPWIPKEFESNPVWEVALNSEGFRDRELPTTKAPGVFRVICLGDSWTFGSSVREEDTYPRQLEGMLAEKWHRPIEVLNLGVMGYASYQGLELLDRWGPVLSPDLVVIGFAMNEPKMIGARGGAAKNLVSSSVLRSEVLALLRYVAARLTYRPTPWKDLFDGRARGAAWADALRSGGGFEPWFEQGLLEYERRIVEMIRSARQRGASVVLLRNELEDSPYRSVLERVAGAEEVPLIDSAALIARQTAAIESELETKLGLLPPPSSEAEGAGVRVVLRVYSADRPVERGVYVTGTDPQLGDLVPNQVAMRDDGSSGDQRAGDRVWSYALQVPPGTRLFYVYTLDGRPGEWEGLDVAAIRWFEVAGSEGSTLYRPIESFGRLYLHADAWHTDARGYELIARAIEETIEGLAPLQPTAPTVNTARPAS